MNKAILVGHLGRDAEMRFTAGGTPVATVSLATTDRYTDRDGQKRKDTQWHRVVIWGKTAEALHEYLVKGKLVYVEGKLKTRKWTNKDGAEMQTTEIVADRIVLLGGAPESATAEQDLPATRSVVGVAHEMETRTFTITFADGSTVSTLDQDVANQALDAKRRGLMVVLSTDDRGHVTTLTLAEQSEPHDRVPY